ncbi:MAG: transcriptional regulator [Gammaproteobacteria bacterium]|nr:transcriptional regulator [Pseudomonadales bacterium]
MSDTDQQRATSLADRWLAHSGRFFLPIWITIVAISIAWGWSVRSQDFLTAENGLGYGLGILGASMMLLLLSYSLRKRLRILRRVLSIKIWFQFHMALGILGPLLILFHSNFRLGSLNSTVALVCMLLVAGSGFIGRYFYSRIHFGLYGEKIRLQQVEKDFQMLRNEILQFAESSDEAGEIDAQFTRIDGLIEQFKQGRGIRSSRAARKAARETARALEQLLHALTARVNSRTVADGELPQQLTVQLTQNLAILMIALKKLPGLQRYERLFSLWHVIHIPVFGLMVITAITHVVAVHMY